MKRTLQAPLLGLALITALGCTETRLLATDAEGPVDSSTPDVGTTGVDGTADIAGGDAGVEDIAPDSGAPEDIETIGDVVPVDGADDAGDIADDAQDDVDMDAGPTVLPPAPRSCVQRFEYDSFGQSLTSVALAGEFNSWDPVADSLTADGTVWSIDFDAANLVGSYAYKFVLTQCPTPETCTTDWVLDPQQPMRKVVGGETNSKVIIDPCTVPALEIESIEASESVLNVVVVARDGADSPGLLPDSAKVTYRGETTVAGWDAATQRFTISMANPGLGKHALTFDIANESGVAQTLYLPIWLESDGESFQWEDAILYFAMTDRFHDGDPSVGGPDDCLPASNKANWQGGDWAGVRQKIESGYFTDLGVNAIWLTAVVDNPGGCFDGQLGKQYTSYHGYFPSAQLTAEDKLGSLADLQAMVRAAHERGIRVLVDLVANHLHSVHPAVTDNPGWFHGYFQCGFEEAPLSCWFESYLPDIDYANDAAVEEMTNAAIWWVHAADFDGFRIDAVKHMHDNFLLTMRQKIRDSVETVPGAFFYTVGETFAGGWGGGNGPNETIIKKYISPDQMTGQFDFPMYWEVLNFFARNATVATGLTDLLEASFGYYGPGSVMSNFLGNHDVPRFISHATNEVDNLFGDGSKELGWDNPPNFPDYDEPYDRLKLAFSFLMSIPGIPLIYYGDEIGMPGAGDPDNRRPMFFDNWDGRQQGVYNHIGAVAAVRSSLVALRRGGYRTLYTQPDVMVFERATADQTVIVALNRSSNSVAIPMGGAKDGTYTGAFGGDGITVSGGSATIDLGPWATRILAQ